MRQHLLVTPLISLAALLVLELTLRYDTAGRQIALALTDAGVLTLLVAVLLRSKFREGALGIRAGIAWLAALGVWFDAAGNFAHLYGTFVWWDKLAHAVGSAAMALVFLLVLRMWSGRVHAALTRTQTFVAAIALTTFVSALYEITEYLGDVWFATLRVTDLYDTADDLLWNIAGAVAVLLVALAWRQRRFDEIPEKR